MFIILQLIVLSLSISPIPALRFKKSSQSSKNFTTWEPTPGGYFTANGQTFDLIKYISSGSFGSVWKASIRERGGFEVAIKFQQAAEVRKDPTLLDEYDNQRRARGYNGGIHNPGVIDLSDQFYLEQYWCMVMELGKGSFYDLHKRPYKMSEQEAKHLFAQVVEAVENSRKNGVVHHDIKPANFLIMEDYNVDIFRQVAKATDYGLSRTIPEGSSDVLLTNHAGTPIYAAPEIYPGNSPPSGYSAHKADVFALGQMLYDMSTGNWANGPNTENGTRVRMPALGTVSYLLQDLIKKMTANDPSIRYTLQDVLDHAWMPVPQCPYFVGDQVEVLIAEGRESVWKPAEVINVNQTNGVMLDQPFPSSGWLKRKDWENNVRKAQEGSCDYYVGQNVEYYGSSRQWIPANVVTVHKTGAFKLDVKQGLWFTRQFAADKVRPARPPPPQRQASQGYGNGGYGNSGGSGYYQGQMVEYWSQSNNQWIPAQVALVSSQGVDVEILNGSGQIRTVRNNELAAKLRPSRAPQRQNTYEQEAIPFPRPAQPQSGGGGWRMPFFRR